MSKADTSDAYIFRVLGAAPFADNEAGIPEMSALIRGLRDERNALRECLQQTRHEICAGPVDDTLWHQEMPACTTVDNITLTLADDWSYDDWIAENETQS